MLQGFTWMILYQSSLTVRNSTQPIILDPYSGEPVQLYPDYQVYHLNGTDKSWELTIPEKKTGSLVHLIPYSFVIFEQCKNEFSLNSSSFKGQILGLLYNASQMWPSYDPNMTFLKKVIWPGCDLHMTWYDLFFWRYELSCVLKRKKRRTSLWNEVFSKSLW